MPATPNEIVTLWSATNIAATSRKAADYDNTDGAGGVLINDAAYVTLTVTYDAATTITANSAIASLYVLPEVDGTYPTGGDGTVGINTDPQDEMIVGSFVARNPSASGSETMALPVRRLPPKGSRFVVRNNSTETLSNTSLKAQMVRLRP
ncbi:MAG: hypothetical protein KatS3mg104_2965 [Phycisphaerae bacterium]|nr:MAG: hypothetical protein KatS3mg104_2965 [Phycisphaerae bacterium]